MQGAGGLWSKRKAWLGRTYAKILWDTYLIMHLVLGSDQDTKDWGQLLGHSMQGEASKVQSWLVSFSLGKSLGWSRRDRYRLRASPAPVPSVLVKD